VEQPAVSEDFDEDHRLSAGHRALYEQSGYLAFLGRAEARFSREIRQTLQAILLLKKLTNEPNHPQKGGPEPSPQTEPEATATGSGNLTTCEPAPSPTPESHPRQTASGRPTAHRARCFHHGPIVKNDKPNLITPVCGYHKSPAAIWPDSMKYLALLIESPGR